MSCIKGFKTFCNFVLPLVYSDELSYYEQICKTSEKLNEIIAQTNLNTQQIAEMKEFMDNYFSNLNIQNEINNKLDQMAQDGTLAQIINENIFNELNGRVTNLEGENTQNQTNITANTNAINQIEPRVTNLENRMSAAENNINSYGTRISNLESVTNKGYVIVMGDSYALGDSSGGQTTSWAYLLGTELVSQGLYDEYVLLAKNGAAFNITGENKFQTMLESYVSSPTKPLANCKAIILGTALNDAWNLSGLWSACHDFHSYARVNFPNARLGVGCIGWTYDTTQWNNFRIAYQEINNAFSRFGQFLTGTNQVMHQYHLFANSDSSHPNAEGQSQIKGAMMNAFINGNFSLFVGRQKLPITAPSGQSVDGNIYQTTDGNNLFLNLSNLKMTFSSPASIACTNASVAKLGDMSLSSCLFISDGKENLAIKTPAILTSGSSFEFAIASINIVAAEILLSFTNTGFTTINNVTSIQFLDTTVMFDRMNC